MNNIQKVNIIAKHFIFFNEVDLIRSTHPKISNYNMIKLMIERHPGFDLNRLYAITLIPDRVLTLLYSYFADYQSPVNTTHLFKAISKDIDYDLLYSGYYNWFPTGYMWNISECLCPYLTRVFGYICTCYIRPLSVVSPYELRKYTYISIELDVKTYREDHKQDHHTFKCFEDYTVFKQRFKLLDIVYIKVEDGTKVCGQIIGIYNMVNEPPRYKIQEMLDKNHQNIYNLHKYFDEHNLYDWIEQKRLLRCR